MSSPMTPSNPSSLTPFVLGDKDTHKDPKTPSVSSQTPSEEKSNDSAANKDTDNSLADMAGRAGETVNAFVTDRVEEISDLQKTVTEHVKNHPIQSSLIALGAGVVLGALANR